MISYNYVSQFVFIIIMVKFTFVMQRFKQIFYIVELIFFIILDLGIVKSPPYSEIMKNYLIYSFTTFIDFLILKIWFIWNISWNISFGIYHSVYDIFQNDK